MLKNFPKGLLGGGATAKLTRVERVWSFSCYSHKDSHGLQLAELVTRANKSGLQPSLFLHHVQRSKETCT